MELLEIHEECREVGLEDELVPKGTTITGIVLEIAVA